jgi:hypothetical protein
LGVRAEGGFILRVARIPFDNEMDMPEDSNKEGHVFSCRGFVDFVSESEERSREKPVQTTTKKRNLVQNDSGKVS